MLHGITQELWRNLRQQGAPLSERGLQLQDIADLYRHAPQWRVPPSTSRSR